MAQTIKLKRSAVAAKEPGTGDLALGELAINTYDGKMYFKKDSGTASIVRLANIGEVVTLTGNQNIAGVKTFSDTTASTSTTTGALTVAGGVGIGGALYTGTDAFINGARVGVSAGGSTNAVFGVNAGLLLNSAATNSVAIGNAALDAVTASRENTAIGQGALTSLTSGAAGITNTTPGTGGTPGTYTDVVLIVESGGTMTVAPTVTLTVAAGGNVSAISITSAGAGASVQSGIVFRANVAGVPTDWRGTLSSVTGLCTAVGGYAMLNNTTGSSNSALGVNALLSNSTGSNNSAVGVSALRINTTGIGNSALGVSALRSNNTGSNNSALGVFALSNSTGSNNSALGVDAGRYRGSGTDSLTAATSSVFIGYQSRANGDSQTNQVVIAGENGLGNGSNTTTIGNSSTTGTYIPNGDLYVDDIRIGRGPNGIDNLVVGEGAGTSLASGSSSNICIGKNAGDACTTGIHNIAIGKNSLGGLTTGMGNLMIASAFQTAATSTVTGNANIVIGAGNNVGITSGSKNIIIGSASGNSAGFQQNGPGATLTTGSNNIIIGNGDVPAQNTSNSIYIACNSDNVINNGSNTTTIGNSSTTGTFIPAGNLVVQNADADTRNGLLVSNLNTGAGASAAVRLFNNSGEVGFVSAPSTNTGGGIGFPNSLYINSLTSAGINIIASNAAGTITFFTGGTAQASNRQMVISSTGNVSLDRGNLVLSSGAGIDFSANANAGGMTSELLDDYEEGTWTPDFTTSGVDFATMTMDIVSAVYTKVGRLVTVTAYIRTDNVDTTSATGTTIISGLPFTAVATNGWSSVNVGDVTAWVNAPSNGYVVPNTTDIYLNKAAANGNTQSHAYSDFTTGAVANQNTFIFSAMYFTS